MFEESLETMLIAKNVRIYLGHSRSLTLLVRPPYVHIRTLLDTASGVPGNRSYWYHVLIDIDG